MIVCIIIIITDIYIPYFTNFTKFQHLRHLSLHSDGLSVELGIHVDLHWLWKPFVKRHRQLATTFNHCKSH